MKIDKKIIILAVLALISYTFLLKPQFVKRNKVKRMLRRKQQILANCFSVKGNLPTKESVSNLKQRNDKLKREYESTAGKIFHKTVSEDTLPFEKEKWPLYFRKTLFVTTAELIDEARKRNAKIPSSFGFTGNVPSEEEVIPLLNKLGLIRKFVLTALDCGVTEIVGLKLLQEDSIPGKEFSKKPGVEQSLEKAGRISGRKKQTEDARYAAAINADFIEECPFVVKLSCNTKSLFRLLYAFQKDYDFFLVQNIQVRENENRLTVDLLLSALYEKKSEVAESPKKKKRNIPVL